jgi:hypothetical protein
MAMHALKRAIHALTRAIHALTRAMGFGLQALKRAVASNPFFLNWTATQTAGGKKTTPKHC